ncbi:Myb-like DNA-binding domain containing protein [Tritrichomonas foetus]|uniref:Myb-like DNA-binding domain containing protein n=1 Tax=Tritrichomonas foetus TaxID=1144522 RepID=A0A1J4J740_9EUKA|nr:Myb-like DNA-binding domain containing protein [Tritrichomonas foetus]|eukprot:OHS93004.1 Myb-like DNA-binding domain containing protein [Tritrichomonas foetus]
MLTKEHTIIHFNRIFRIEIRNYSQFIMKTPQSRNHFTKNEDNLIMQLVIEYGACGWKEMAKKTPGRSARQIRERYTNYLSPNVSKEPWTQEEDQLLLRKVDEFGKKWALISAFFPRRTDVIIKNRFMRITRVKTKKGEKSFESIKIPQTHLIMPLINHMTSSNSDQNLMIQQIQEIPTSNFQETQNETIPNAFHETNIYPVIENEDSVFSVCNCVDNEEWSSENCESLIYFA